MEKRKSKAGFGTCAAPMCEEDRHVPADRPGETAELLESSQYYRCMYRSCRYQLAHGCCNCGQCLMTEIFMPSVTQVQRETRISSDGTSV